MLLCFLRNYKFNSVACYGVIIINYIKFYPKIKNIQCPELTINLLRYYYSAKHNILCIFSKFIFHSFLYNKYLVTQRKPLQSMAQYILKLGLCTIQDSIKTKPVLNVEMTGGWWKPHISLKH